MKRRQDAGGPAGWKPALLFFIFLSAPQLFAQVLASTPRGVLVARERVVELADRWKADGVANPTSIVVGTDRAAIIDALANEARIIDLASGQGRTVRTDETPIDGIFAGNDLFILCRDAGTIQRAGGESLPVGADPVFLRYANGRLYVYQRMSGTISELTLEPLAIRRRVSVAAFASDFETDGNHGYLTLPRTAKIATFSLADMKATGTIDAGAVPVDIALGGGGTALTARGLAIADPASKRVWMIEGSQSLSQAFARGFLRGLLGLGLYSNRSSQFPTGIDRVANAAGRWIAYDSSTGTLYRFSKSRSEVIAAGIATQAFTVTADGVYYWTKATGLRRQASGPPPPR